MSTILIGITKNKAKISVCKNCEGFANIPHFMYESDNKRKSEIISILEARLIDTDGNLELEERNDLEVFLSSINEKYNITNWEVIKKVWNENNKTQIPKYSHKPYYRNLIEYVDTAHFSDYDRDKRLEGARVYCGTEVELEPHFHYVLPDGSDIAISFLEAEYLYPLERKLTEREIENLITFLKGSHPDNRWNCTNWELGIITWNRQNYDRFKYEYDWESIYPNHKKLDENLQIPDYRLLNRENKERISNIKQSKISDIERKIREKLKIKRKLTEYEKSYIEKWLDCGYSFESIELALEKAKVKIDSIVSSLDDMLCYMYWGETHNFKEFIETKGIIENKREIQQKQYSQLHKIYIEILPKLIKELDYILKNDYSNDVIYTLATIIEREIDIKNRPYYSIAMRFGEDGIFKAQWKVTENSVMYNSPKLLKNKAFRNENDIKEFISSLNDKTAKIFDLKKVRAKENAPLLFNLEEMQKEATKRFKIKPNETLAIMQELYKNKLIAYPITNARVLPTAVAEGIIKNLEGIAKGFNDKEIQSYIKKILDEKYSTNIIRTKYVDDMQITDYYAIIPTGEGFENYEKLNELQKSIYKLIVKRFLSIFYPPAEYEKVYRTVIIQNETFIAVEKKITKQGYLEILDQEQDNEIKLEKLQSLQEGQEIEVTNFEIEELDKDFPERYSSGSIIIAMEELGLGTSWTRAEIIKELEKLGYINVEKSTCIIIPTEKGKQIYNMEADIKNKEQ